MESGSKELAGLSLTEALLSAVVLSCSYCRNCKVLSFKIFDTQSQSHMSMINSTVTNENLSPASCHGENVTA